ncbi:MAG: nucleotidyltransferase family protein [Firmicutes bacterium]|nr:nucleotidyltransferase family protein [Bacillota bacterium]
MKICAVICEFNPFHNGHKYVLEQAKEVSKCDAVLCVMSGNFVQRAEPSIAGKAFRTKTALENGAVFVVELPVMFATMTGELFSYGAINIINQVKNVTHLAFGSECGNIEQLKKISNLQLSEEFNQKLRNLLKSGMSYSNAMSILSEVELKSNDILGIEYIKQLIKTGSNIEPIAIQRQKSDYNDAKLIKNFSSATAIRETIKNITAGEAGCHPHRIIKPNCKTECITTNCGRSLTAPTVDLSTLKSNVPNIDELIGQLTKHPVDYSLFEKLVITSIRNNDNLSSLVDAGEGLEIKLKKNALEYSNLEKICEETKSKRYTMSRIKRLCLQSLFHITPQMLSKPTPIPLRVLGVKGDFKKHLNIFPKKNTIISTKDYDKLKRKHFDYLKKEKEAENIFSLLTSSPSRFYSYQLVVV